MGDWRKVPQLLSDSVENLTLAKRLFLIGSVESFQSLHLKNENVYTKMQLNTILLSAKRYIYGHRKRLAKARLFKVTSSQHCLCESVEPRLEMRSRVRIGGLLFVEA